MANSANYMRPDLIIRYVGRRYVCNGRLIHEGDAEDCSRPVAGDVIIINRMGYRVVKDPYSIWEIDGTFSKDPILCIELTEERD